MKSVAVITLMSCILGSSPFAASRADIEARLANDLAESKPVVVHVIVALCDNRHQGIVPVSATLGNGQDARNNLYWGAMYGIRSHLLGAERWRPIAENIHDNDSILASFAAVKTLRRGQDSITVYLVAEGWDGRYIRAATMRFLDMVGGTVRDTVRLDHGHDTLLLSSGGDAHLICYVGHNGLMDFTPARYPMYDSTAEARSAVVLACASKSYFQEILQRIDAHPLLLTTNLMAPEAYTLAAVIQSFVSGESAEIVVSAAARAYATYQKCSPGAARGLFYSAP